jgi:hypothetical protein
VTSAAVRRCRASRRRAGRRAVPRPHAASCRSARDLAQLRRPPACASSADANSRAAFSGCSRSWLAAATNRVLPTFASSACRLAAASACSACGQRVRALLDAPLEALLRLEQGLLRALVLGDVRVGRDVAAVRHRLAADLVDAAVAPLALERVRRAGAQVREAAGDLLLRLAGAEFAALGVEADQVGRRATDVDDPVGVVEHLEIAAVPGDQLQVRVDHADALRDVLHRRLQQLAAEVELLRGLVEELGDLVHLDAPATERVRQQHARGRRPERTRQRPLDVLQQRTVGRVGRARHRTAAADRPVDEQPPRGRRADDPRRQRLEVAHPCGAGAGRQRRAATAAPRTPSRPAARAASCRGGARRPATPRRSPPSDHSAPCASAPDAPKPSSDCGRGTEPQRAVGDDRGRRRDGRQHQRVQPEREAGGEPPEHASARRAAPVERREDAGRELRERGEREQPDLREARRRAGLAVVGIGQQREPKIAPRRSHSTRSPRSSTATSRERPSAGSTRSFVIIVASAMLATITIAVAADSPPRNASSASAGSPSRSGSESSSVSGVPGAGPACSASITTGTTNTREQRQIGRERPARALQVARLDALDHAHLELARQAERGADGQQRRGREVHALQAVPSASGASGAERRLLQLQPRPQADADEREHLHDRLERDREHQALRAAPRPTRAACRTARRTGPSSSRRRARRPGTTARRGLQAPRSARRCWRTRPCTGARGTGSRRSARSP